MKVAIYINACLLIRDEALAYVEDGLRHLAIQDPRPRTYDLALRAVSDPAGTAPSEENDAMCICGRPASDHDSDMNAGTNGECLHSWRGDESIEFCECIKFVSQSPAGTAPTTGGTDGE